MSLPQPGVLESMSSNWPHNLNMNWLEDDDDQDSDTDSKLSGSAAADSVLRHLSRFKQQQQGTEFSLDPMREQDEYDAESAEGGAMGGSFGSSGAGLSNGYHHHHHQDGRGGYRPQDLTSNSSPKFSHRRNYENAQMGGGYLHASRKKDLLSPVIESTAGGARVVEISVPPGSSSPAQYHPSRKWSAPGPNTRSMENMATRGTPPSRRRGPGGRSYEPHIPNGRPSYREVRVPQTNGLGAGLGGSSPLAAATSSSPNKAPPPTVMVEGWSTVGRC